MLTEHLYKANYEGKALQSVALGLAARTSATMGSPEKFTFYQYSPTLIMACKLSTLSIIYVYSNLGNLGRVPDEVSINPCKGDFRKLALARAW
jgi:hypothetical protein